MLGFPATRLSRVGRWIGMGWLLASLALPVAAKPIVATLAPAPLRDALRAAWQNHPTSQATEATLAAARARAEAAGQPLYNPEVDLDAEKEGDARTTTAGLSLTLDLSGKRRVRESAAAARIDQVTAEAARVRVEIEAEQRRATESFAAARAAWTRWRSSRGTDIDRRAELLERLWREGELSTADYLLQLKQTLETALAGAELEARLWRSYTDYLAATGQLERWSGLEGTP